MKKTSAFQISSLRSLALAWVCVTASLGWMATSALAQTPPVQALAVQPVPQPVVSPDGRAYQYTLSNGMTLIVRPDHRAPTVAHMLWVRVGAMDEVDGISGVAHVLEHMMFKGTPSVPAGEFSRRVAALGGRENAFTSRDYTAYFQQIPSDQLGAVMKLEADRFAQNAWADDEFAREIEVVKEERRMRTEDNPRSLLYEALNAAAFVASPYHRPIIGWQGDLDAMQADDVRQFWRTWYTPSNAAIVVAGDVQPEQALALAKQYYEPIPAREVPQRKPRPEPVQMGMRSLELKAPAEQSYLMLAFKVPGLKSVEMTQDSDQDALALTVLSAVLDGYSGARLERALTQGTQRLADRVGSSNGLLGRGPQLFMLDAVLAPQRSAAEVQSALREQIARIAREGVSDEELQRVKTQWVASEVYKLDSVFYQANELGSQWAYGFPLGLNDRLMERLRAITPEQVKSVAARYFGDDQMTVAVLKPQPLDASALQKKRTPRPAGDHVR